MSKIFLFNAGTRTRRAFALGMQTSTLHNIKTKTIVAHLKNKLPVAFIDDNTELNFRDSYIFTRLRANDAHFCGILYEHFDALGIPASDPISLSYPHAEEKIAQMARFVRAGINIPETIIAREEGFVKNWDYINSVISYPLVYKLDGSQGNQVFLVQNQTELETLLNQKPVHQRFILQEYIENTFDTRTLVAYGKVLGSIKRSAKPGQFHNNVAKGGLVERYTLTKEEEKLAIQATITAKLDFGGVDIIHTVNGPLILEVNKSPQIAGFERIFGENSVFKSIAEIIEARL